MAQPSMKDAIVDAARAEFHEHGYAATGIAAITSRAGAHKGSFYNHFSSKEELAADVVRLYAKDQQLDILQDKNLAPLERIRTHFQAIAGVLMAGVPILGCLLANFSAEVSTDAPLVKESVTGSVAQWAELIASNLEEAAKNAGVKTSDAESIAWLLLDGYEGAAVRARASGSAAPLQGFLDYSLPSLLASFEG